MNHTLIKIMFYAVLLLGIFLRVEEYAANRSFWLDEANVAYKVQHLPIEKIIRSADDGFGTLQPLPLGFILVLRGAARFLGDDEYALRLFPLICGILAMIFFYVLSKKLLPPFWALAAFFSFDLIYYSSELKPYSSDVLILLLLIVTGVQTVERKFDQRYLLFTAGLGGIALWCSFSSAFALFSVFAYLLFSARQQGEKKLLLFLSLTALGWLISAWAYYEFSLRHFIGKSYLRDYWASGFLPRTSDVFRVFQWCVVIFQKLFENLLQYPAGLCAVLFSVSVCACCLRRDGKGLLLILPVAVTFFFALLRVYPFYDRPILFLMPCIMLLVFRGANILTERMRDPAKNIIRWLILCLLLFHPLRFTFLQFREKKGIEDIKHALEYLQTNALAGDQIVISYSTVPAYRYYAPRYGLTMRPEIIAKDMLDRFANEEGCFDFLDDGRVWLLYTHVSYNHSLNRREGAVSVFERCARREDHKITKLIPQSVPRRPEHDISAALYLFNVKK
ncbi:MAG: glycosyltransferase family 39 protein [Candidatus Omnitrophica bacterium]|nr:glycosyltransferase family 39 protein [Candidatus Omnitrophota bacterium]